MEKQEGMKIEISMNPVKCSATTDVCFKVPLGRMLQCLVEGKPMMIQSKSEDGKIFEQNIFDLMSEDQIQQLLRSPSLINQLSPHLRSNVAKRLKPTIPKS